MKPTTDSLSAALKHAQESDRLQTALDENDILNAFDSIQMNGAEAVEYRAFVRKVVTRQKADHDAALDAFMAQLPKGSE